jgi:L-threonylcarbamoyladenylate synthase
VSGGPEAAIPAALRVRLAQAAAVLRSGGVIAYPTETFYGLGALASHAGAVARVAAAKGRPDGKPLPLLAASLAQVEAVAELSPEARRLAAAFWPGPLTLVLPARPGVLDAITGGGATVGVRVTSSPVAATLATMSQGALVATSANLAGAPPAASVEALDPALVARLDLVLDAGPAPGGLPSTVVALGDEGLILVRAGAIGFERLEAAFAGG